MYYFVYDIIFFDVCFLFEIVEFWGIVDVLINNVGYLFNKFFYEIIGIDWENVMSVNFYGFVYLL